jgi:iron complex outermembrane receptor protein
MQCRFRREGSEGTPSAAHCARRSLSCVLVAALIGLGSHDFAIAATDDLSVDRVAAASLEELMGIQVTSVSGSVEHWFRSPAAISVATGEDLRRTGHRTLAELLRVMPGVYVGTVNAHAWTVGMRGFTGGLANKTLVLIDGRAVYDPLLGGTFWDIQDILLTDLDRIEVIRGPGATLWGANAVNGVINVITKHTRDTQGVHARVGAGLEEQGFASARYGGKVSERAHYRVWGKYSERDHYSYDNDESAHDAWDIAHGGFRYDFDYDAATALTVQGDVYNLGHLGERTRVPVPGAHLQFNNRIDQGWANGGNMLARVVRSTSPTSGWAMQAWYDRTHRKQGAGFRFERDTADVDFRHHFRLGERNDLHWGLGYRYSTDDTRASETIVFRPESRDFHTVNGFVQDTVTLMPERLFAMLGTKLEHNDFTGFEVQPSGRLWWTPDDRNTLWAAVSRPVRVPSRIEQDVILTIGIADTGELGNGPPSGVFVPLTIFGERAADSEKLIAYEVGYRRKITDRLTIDIAPFYNDYTHLIFAPKSGVGELGSGSGESYGFEVASMWRPIDRWNLAASYSWLDVQIHGDLAPLDEGTAPTNMVKLLSYFDVTDRLQLNTALYYIDEIPAVPSPEHVRLDQGIVWKARSWLDLGIWGQNLLEDTHRESSAVRVERGFYAQATVNF